MNFIVFAFTGSMAALGAMVADTGVRTGDAAAAGCPEAREECGLLDAAGGGVRLSCKEVLRRLEDEGWRDLKARDCSGPRYRVTGWRAGKAHLMDIDPGVGNEMAPGPFNPKHGQIRYLSN